MIASLGPAPEVPKGRGRLQPLAVSFVPQTLLEYTAGRPRTEPVPGCSCSFRNAAPTENEAAEPVVEHRAYDAVLLVADLSGFSALSSRLALEGELPGHSTPPGSASPVPGEDGRRRERQRWAADELSKRVNATMEAMLNTAAGFGMDAVKFAGDAVTFMRRYGGPERSGVAGGGADEAVREAVECALRLLQEVQENPDFSLHCALGMGRVVEAHLGTPQRKELVLLGAPVHEVSVGVSLSKAGQIAVPASMIALLSGGHQPVPSRPLGDGAYHIVELSEAMKAEPLGGDGLAMLGAPRKGSGDSVNRRASDPWLGRCGACMEAALRPYLPVEALPLLRSGPSLRMWAEIRPVSAAFFQLPLAFDAARDSEVDAAALTRLDECLKAVITAVEDTDGAFRSFLVDDKGASAFATWGVETAHEDDSERAVMSALRARDALVAMGEAAPATGVTTGRAYCGLLGCAHRYDYSVLGDTINVACRLMGMGAGLVVDQTTASLLPQPPFVLSPVGRVMLKGKSEPQPVFRVEGARAGRSTSTRGNGNVTPRGSYQQTRADRDQSPSHRARRRPASLILGPSGAGAEGAPGGGGLGWRRPSVSGAGLGSSSYPTPLSPVLRALHSSGSPLSRSIKRTPPVPRIEMLDASSSEPEPVPPAGPSSPAGHRATAGAGAGPSGRPSSSNGLLPASTSWAAKSARRLPQLSWNPLEPSKSFVGRRAALQSLEDFVLSCDGLRPLLPAQAPPPPMRQQLSDTPVPRVLLIEGEAGVGKSALGRLACSWLPTIASVRVLVCSAPPAEGSQSPRGALGPDSVPPFFPFRASFAETLGLQSLLASRLHDEPTSTEDTPHEFPKEDEVLDASAPHSNSSSPRSSHHLPSFVLGPSLWERNNAHLDDPGSDPEMAADALRAVVKAVVQLDPSLAIHAEFITAALGLAPFPADSAGGLAKMRSVLASLLSLSIAREPTVLFLEDIHRFDPPSLELLSELRRLPNGPAAVIATARPEDGSLPLAHLRTEAHTCSIHLGPMSESETCDLMCSALNVTAPSEPTNANALASLPERWLAHVVHVQSGGIPRRTLETLALLLANRTIIVSRGRLKIFSVEGVAEVVDLATPRDPEFGASPESTPRPPAPSLTSSSSLPDSFDKLIMSRLDAMNKEASLVITLLAVFNGLFTASMAEDVCGPELGEPGRVKGRLASLVSGGWLAQRRIRSPSEAAAAAAASAGGGSGPSDGTAADGLGDTVRPVTRGARIAFCFLHEGTREVVYLRLMGEKRAELHARAAAALEALPWSEREALGVKPLDLASHYRASGNARAAIRQLTIAGTAAARSGSLEEAIAALEGALDLEASRGPSAVRVPSLAPDERWDVIELRTSPDESPEQMRERVGRRVLLARVLRIAGRLNDCRNVCERVLVAWPETAAHIKGARGAGPARAGRVAAGARRLSLGTRRALLWTRAVASAATYSPSPSGMQGLGSDAQSAASWPGARWAASSAERDAGSEVGLGGTDEDSRDEALAVYELALRHAGDHSGAAHAALLRWSLLGRRPQAARVAEAASRAAAAVDWFAFGGRVGAAAASKLRALACATADRLPPVGRLLAHKAAVLEAEAQAHILGCRAEAAAATAKQGVLLARQFGRPSLTLSLHLLEVLALYYGGKLRDCREATERLLWHTSSLRSQPHACWASIVLALVQMAAGEHPDAIETLERATILAKSLGTAGRAPEGGGAAGGRAGAPFILDTGMISERRAACALLGYAVGEACNEGTLAESALAASLDSQYTYASEAARPGGIDPVLEAPAVCALLDALAKSHARLGEELAEGPEGLKRALARRRALRRRQFAAAYALLSDRAGPGADLLTVPLMLFAAVREREFKGRRRAAARLAERARAAARARGLTIWEVRALQELHALDPGAGHAGRAGLLVAAALS